MDENVPVTVLRHYYSFHYSGIAQKLLKLLCPLAACLYSSFCQYCLNLSSCPWPSWSHPKMSPPNVFNINFGKLNGHSLNWRWSHVPSHRSHHLYTEGPYVRPNGWVNAISFYRLLNWTKSDLERLLIKSLGRLWHFRGSLKYICQM